LARQSGASSAPIPDKRYRHVLDTLQIRPCVGVGHHARHAINHFLSGTGGGGDMPQWVNTFLASSGNQEAAKRRIESLVE